jgi:hypothetical protein
VAACILLAPRPARTDRRNSHASCAGRALHSTDVHDARPPGDDADACRARSAVPLVRPEAMPAYQRLVDLGFTGAGGSLCASLSRRYGAERVTAAFRATRVPADLPVGAVWPEQWLTLFRLLEACG